MTRTFLTVVIAMLLIATAVEAQDAPRFFIEKIEVRNNKRVSADVIVAESLLRTGSEYSEADLRDASARLSRLPFLLAAEFALERGSERGQHVLVINVIETRNFFFRLDVVPILSDEPTVNADRVSQLGSDQTSATIGYRWFLGRRGALHVALVGRDETEFTRGYSAFAIGYTRYDIFGTRAFATINIKDTPDGGGLSPQVVVGVPLSLNQTLTAEYDETVANFTLYLNRPLNENPLRQEEMQRIARLTWSYNTTNHPYLPTLGSLMSVTPLVIWRDDNTFLRNDDGLYRVVPVRTRTVGIQASAIRYWELTDRLSASSGAEGGWGTSDESTADPTTTTTLSNEYTIRFAAVHTGLSYSLWTPERRAAGGESRVELIARGRVRDTDRPGQNPFIDNETDVIQASVSWVRHSSWGTFRVGAGYAW